MSLPPLPPEANTLGYCPVCQKARGNGHIQYLNGERGGGRKEREAIGSCPFKKNVVPGVFQTSFEGSEKNLGMNNTTS